MKRLKEEILRTVLRAAYEKKGEDILLLDLRKTVPFLCDYFIIITGYTKEHLQAISDHIVESLDGEGVFLDHMEGYEVGRWILLDYLDFVIHIMTKEAREFYSLETLWGDAPTKRYPEDFRDEHQEADRRGLEAGG